MANPGIFDNLYTRGDMGEVLPKKSTEYTHASAFSSLTRGFLGKGRINIETANIETATTPQELNDYQNEQRGKILRNILAVIGPVALITLILNAPFAENVRGEIAKLLSNLGGDDKKAQNEPNEPKPIVTHKPTESLKPMANAQPQTKPTDEFVVAPTPSPQPTVTLGLPSFTPEPTATLSATPFPEITPMPLATLKKTVAQKLRDFSRFIANGELPPHPYDTSFFNVAQGRERGQYTGIAYWNLRIDKSNNNNFESFEYYFPDLSRALGGTAGIVTNQLEEFGRMAQEDGTSIGELIIGDDYQGEPIVVDYGSSAKEEENLTVVLQNPLHQPDKEVAINGLSPYIGNKGDVGAAIISVTIEFTDSKQIIRKQTATLLIVRGRKTQFVPNQKRKGYSASRIWVVEKGGVENGVYREVIGSNKQSLRGDTGVWRTTSNKAQTDWRGLQAANDQRFLVDRRLSRQPRRQA